MAKTTVRHVAALFAGLSLLAAACGSSKGSSSDTTGAPATEAPTTAAAAPTTEAGASTSAGASGGTAGALAGMKGTTPLVELSQGFKDKLLKVDPALKDYNYAAETYDAVTVIALAAEKEDRVALPNAKLLIHQPLVGGVIHGSASDLEIHARDIIELKKKMHRLYAERTGTPQERFVDLMERDRWIDPQAAIDLGLISKVVSVRKELDTLLQRGQ